MKTRSSTSSNALEFRRLRAIDLFNGGMKAMRIAKVPGVNRNAVSQWLKRYREQGINSLYHRIRAKRPGKLSAIQFQELTRMLLQGAENFGYTGDVWTRSRIRDLIEIKFSVKFSVRHVRRLMKEIRVDTPEAIHIRKSEKMEEVQLWRGQRWPDIKKST